ncbi:MAG: hypothetical protein EA402_10435 [Planctomycetota bacterium]|nr:MAG: hypothetical protein EA402_10435 [Planctomycetota bacterium]
MVGLRQTKHCFILSGLFLLAGCTGGGTAWLPLEDDPPGIYRLSWGQEVPLARWPGPLYAHRLIDDDRYQLWDDEGNWRDVPPGIYRTADGDHLVLRHGEGVAAHAHSLLGAPVVASASGHERARAVAEGAGYDALSLPIHVWRLVDQEPWPWVDHLGSFGGLANFLQRQHGREGLRFDAAEGLYRDIDGRPVRIGGDMGGPGITLQLGDFLSSGDGQEVAITAILVKDRGRIGYLDPEDVVVTTQITGGAASWLVREDQLGLLIGPAEVYAFRRDGQRLVQHLERRLSGDNPVWTMEPQRVWMLIAGMVILIAALMRWARRRQAPRDKV